MEFFSTRASVAIVLSMHPYISICLSVNLLVWELLEYGHLSVKYSSWTPHNIHVYRNVSTDVFSLC